MFRQNNYTTILLTVIVLLLLLGVGVAVYYVLDLDWFTKKPIDIYNELDVYGEQLTNQVIIKKEIKYDASKRTYGILTETDEVKIIVYKDGTVGATCYENDNVVIYKEYVNKEIKLDINNIVRAYLVKVANSKNTIVSYIVLLDFEGNLYKLPTKELLENGKITLEKVEGLAKIIDVRQITNDELNENTEGINVIAIDENSNELLLTEYLLKKEQ